MESTSGGSGLALGTAQVYIFHREQGHARQQLNYLETAPLIPKHRNGIASGLRGKSVPIDEFIVEDAMIFFLKYETIPDQEIAKSTNIKSLNFLL